MAALHAVKTLTRTFAARGHNGTNTIRALWQMSLHQGSRHGGLAKSRTFLAPSAPRYAGQARYLSITNANVTDSPQYQGLAIGDPTVLGPTVLAIAILGFALIAFDVTAPSSLHLLESVDQAAHEFAAAQSPYFRTVVADKLLSDLPIALGIAGWLLSSVVIIAAGNWRKTAVVALASSFYIFLTGPVAGDPWLVALFKNTFQRIRPSDYHISYAFPSGHTSSVVFLIGALLFVLLPLALAGKNPSGGAMLAIVSLLRKLQGSWRFWILASLTTASGRVLADAHWLSDTLCGACLSTAVVVVLLQMSRFILSYKARV